MPCCFGGGSGADRDGGPSSSGTDRDGGKKGRKHGRGAYAPDGPGRERSLSFGSDDDEYFDAEDTLVDIPRSWKRTESGKAANSILEAKGIVLETRPAPEEGVGRCVIPRHDIPFETPEAGRALSWSANPLGMGFRLRGKNYKKDGKKFYSEKPLFEVVQVLVAKANSKRLDFGDLFFGGEIGELVHGCPTVYVANFCLPDYPPPNPIFGSYDKKIGPDGPSNHITIFCRMSEETRDEIEKHDGDTSKMDPAVGLMVRHFRAKGHDKNGLDDPPHKEEVRTKTKMVAMVAHGAASLPWAVRVAIGQGNGKPFMVNKTGYFTRRDGKGSFECGINVHNFGQVALNGLRTCGDYFSRLVLDVGGTIQGDDPSELPERLLFALRVIKPDLRHIKVTCDELDMDAADHGKDEDARPWLDWEGLKMAPKPSEPEQTSMSPSGADFKTGLLGKNGMSHTQIDSDSE